MNVYRKLEIGCGVATVVLSVAAAGIVEVPRVSPDFNRYQVVGIAAYLMPPLLVMLGSFFDAAKRKMFGVVVLWFGGLLLTLSSFAGVFGGGLYIYGLWSGLAMASPAVPAIGSMTASLVIRKRASAT